MITTILLWTGAVTLAVITGYSVVFLWGLMTGFIDDTCFVGWHTNREDTTWIFTMIILKFGVCFVETGSDIEKSVKQGKWPWKPIKTYRVTKNYSVFPVHPWQRLSKKEIRKELP